MMKPLNVSRWLVVVFGASALGCGAGLADVSGLVSIDGKPAPPGLKITFEPRDGKSEPVPSVTDTSGRYRLIHRSGKPGIPSGTYKVSLGFWGDPSTNPPELAVLKIPKDMQEATSTLVCDVKPGGTEFNIDVKSR